MNKILRILLKNSNNIVIQKESLKMMIQEQYYSEAKNLQISLKLMDHILFLKFLKAMN